MEKKKIDHGKGSAYVGGALMHENGFVYAVVKAELYKIDPETMSVAARVSLPLSGLGEDTVYNGLAVIRDGTLVAKSFTFSGKEGFFILLDPDSLATYSSLETDTASARICISVGPDGQEYLYHTNATRSFRYLVSDNKLNSQTRSTLRTQMGIYCDES